MSNPNQVREQLERALANSATHFGRGAVFMGLVGSAAVVGSLVRGIYWLLAISVVFFGGLVGLMIMTSRRTKSHPLGRVILDQPERITEIRYQRTSSSSGAFPSHWLMFGDGQQTLGLRFEESLIHALAPFLARTFVNATIVIPPADR